MSQERARSRFANVESPAIVTGAGSGIGRATALALAGAGAGVALVDANEAALEETAREVKGEGGYATAFALDVTDDEAVHDTVATIARTMGAPRTLVNGAGIVIRKQLMDTTLEEWKRVLDVNLTGYFSMLHATVPLMAEAGGGSIVQISSSSAHVGGHGYAAYSAAKGGVLSLTRMLAKELAPSRIRINSVSPGPVETGINRESFSNPAIRQGMERSIPWGRIGAPEDVADAVVFLTSQAAGYITGIDVLVDGGLLSAVDLNSTADD